MTQTQITECTDEEQLREWAAIYCMKWKLKQVRVTNGHVEWKIPKYVTKGFEIKQDDWQPTSPTEKGKAQCWDLAVKYGLVVEFISGDYCAHYSEYYMGQSKGHVEHENPQIAVVKAAILSALNGEEYE